MATARPRTGSGREDEGGSRSAHCAITVSDPFGVARVTSVGSEASSFLAYPRTEPLTLPKDTGKRRTTVVSARRQPTGAQGEDFYTLREYVEGDDLRRIHWPATAKRNRYMIRQEETPWHARATILLDETAGTYAGAGWERAVEVAASLADLYHRSAYNFRLLGVADRGIEGRTWDRPLPPLPRPPRNGATGRDRSKWG